MTLFIIINLCTLCYFFCLILPKYYTTMFKKIYFIKTGSTPIEPLIPLNQYQVI